MEPGPGRPDLNRHAYHTAQRLAGLPQKQPTELQDGRARPLAHVYGISWAVSGFSGHHHPQSKLFRREIRSTRSRSPDSPSGVLCDSCSPEMGQRTSSDATIAVQTTGQKRSRSIGASAGGTSRSEAFVVSGSHVGAGKSLCGQRHICTRGRVGRETRPWGMPNMQLTLA